MIGLICSKQMLDVKLTVIHRYKC